MNISRNERNKVKQTKRLRYAVGLTEPFHFQQSPHETYNGSSLSVVWEIQHATILVFLCGRAVVLAAQLLYNGTHSGSSKQRAERNQWPGH